MLRCSKVEVIATQILRSSTRFGWPLRNVHISNDNGSVTLDFVFLLLLSPDLSLYMNITRPVYYKKQELLTIREHLSSPLPHLCFFLGRVRVAHLFSFLYCLIMCLYVLSSMLCCPLCYPHKNDGRFIFAATCL
jgi:hypothetical protein